MEYQIYHFQSCQLLIAAYLYSLNHYPLLFITIGLRLYLSINYDFVQFTRVLDRDQAPKNLHSRAQSAHNKNLKIFMSNRNLKIIKWVKLL